MVEALRPQNLEEALSFISINESFLLSGGTDLMVKKKRWSGVVPNFDKPVVFIGHLTELKGISEEESYIRIGAACTYAETCENELIPEFIKTAIEDIASPGIRNIGTIGGNICNASPAGDILPPLYAAEAILVLKSVNGERRVPIENFILGPGKTDIKGNEVLISILIPKKDFSKFFYRKVGTRKSIALAKLSFIGIAETEEGIIKDIRMAFGAVGPTIVKSKDIESRIIGLEVGKMKEMISEIEKEYEGLLRPINDQRSSAAYRKKVSLNLMKKFLNEM